MNQSDPTQMQIALQEIIEGILDNLGNSNQKLTSTDAGTFKNIFIFWPND